MAQIALAKLERPLITNLLTGLAPVPEEIAVVT